MTKFTQSTKRKEEIPTDVTVKRLREQLKYQYGRLGFVIANGGKDSEKEQYHLDKIAYIEGKLKELVTAEE